MKLVEIAELTKRAVIILTALVTLYVVFLILKNPVKNIYYAVFPPKDLPDLAFGLLDPLEFTEIQTISTNPEYVLNTRTGQLPDDLETKMRVYKYFEPRFSFSEGKNAQNDALALGFTDDMRISDLNDPFFVWEDVTFGGTLEIDTNNRVLNLNTPLANKGSLFPAGQLTQTIAVETAKGLLEKIGRISDKLYTLDTRGSQTVFFGKFSQQGVVEADSIPETQIARVDFYRQVFDFPILGPDPKEGLLQVYVRAPNLRDNEYPQLNFPKVKAAHWEINTDDTASYPIIPVSTAWEQVSLNNGVIANATPSGASPFENQPPVRIDRILINEIYLAYFDNDKPQTYMQPIYVFEGNYTSRGTNQAGSITIYYPAIGGQYIQGTQTNQSGQL